MFLGWIPQLLANVDSQKIFAISKVIIRIAEAYPQAIMYPYRLSKENYNFKDNNVADEARFLINSLDKLLLSDEMVDKFLRALSYVSVPAGVLRYYVGKMYNSDNENNITANQNSIMDEIFGETPDSGKVSNMQGNMFKKIGKFKKDFAKMMGTKKTKMKDDLKKINGELANMLKSEKASSLLKDYCPWLANFSANRLSIDLEIPGQYDGQKLPLTQHHVKISGFCPNVHVMSSLRKPIKLTILGLDTKEYPFLVKFGEDIRQDQRIQQLFGLMNDIFKSDTSYACADLDILTYQVIPLTSNLGIIQWINDTQPLSDFIIKSLKDKKTFDKISNDYINRLYKAQDAIHIYGLSAMKYNRDKTISFYRSLVNKIPWDVMRTSFWSLSTNTKNYIALRNNFIKSYAVLCTCQWILGIGDRHLNNSLICVRNGKVLGIDFGHAFGTGTQILPVPELVPFRLTPHIVSLMEPLKERGQFRESMIHSLRALRVNYTSLLATMNVFIEEPSLDWLEHASKFESTSKEKTHNWYPNVKVDQARRKLQGASSTKIVIEDLIAGQKVPKYTEAYVKLVAGLPEHDVRAKFVDENLTVESQVDCLIDHATDYNLLGRMYVGWMPFV
ncbi:hypothetical protein NQ314_006391 [Rhamnusium bicolor]|uniref:non-specific serine/threonine protein kinase n=1 Tax=Rhamnusium bicolor TaxID=1586634 RepID=A0AAV8Z3A9_9CUCU|nr:hypothetical protein NQ314_006391 [Rhamnusium bicolor]